MTYQEKTEAARPGAAIDSRETNYVSEFSTVSSCSSTYLDLEQKCLRDMSNNGFPLKGSLNADGEVHRFSIDNTPSKKDEWYVARTWWFKGIPYLHCTYGSWKSDKKTVFQSWRDKEVGFSIIDREEFSKHVREMEKIAEEERKRRQEEAAIEAKERWDLAERAPITEGHKAYLQLKNIEPYSIRFGKNPSGHDAIILPLWNIQGAIRSLQFISVNPHDHSVYKTFLSGGEKKGCFFVIASLKQAESFFVVEGFATGASLYKADGRPVVISFDCGNLEAVVGALRTKYKHQEIIIAGDDDVETNDNPGRSKANNVAGKHNCKVVFPKFPSDLKLENGKKPTDFNDLYSIYGHDEVKKQLQDCVAYIENNAEKIDEDSPNQSNEKANPATSSDLWGNPIEFQETLPPVPAFDPLLLPKAFQHYAEDVAERMQCPIEFVVVPLLVGFSSLIGCGCSIRPKQRDNWTIIPNLWGGIIGPPSVLKTPALNEGMVPIAHLEKLADEKYEELSISNKSEQVEIKLRKARIEGQLKEAISHENDSAIEGCKAALTSLEKEACLVPWKRYKTNDATIEKLAEILRDNPRGILIFRDELIGFLVSLEKEGREGDRAFYLEGWNGHSSSPVKSDRIGRGTISCNPCISVLGGIQPSKLRSYLFDTVNDISNDGLFQRFQVMVYPDIPKTFKLIDREPNRKAKDRVINIALKIAETDFISMGAKIEDNYPLPILRFDPSAQEFFNIWYSELKNRQLTGGDDEFFVQHLGKYPKLLASLALINYLVRVADGESSSSVSYEDVNLAAALCAYLEAHARRIYSIVEHRSVLKAKSLLKKLKQGDLVDGFSLRDVYRKGWSGLTTANDAGESLAELVERGWLKEEKVPGSPQGGGSTARYRIHPTLLKVRGSLADTTDETDK